MSKDTVDKKVCLGEKEKIIAERLVFLTDRSFCAYFYCY